MRGTQGCGFCPAFRPFNLAIVRLGCTNHKLQFTVGVEEDLYILFPFLLSPPPPPDERGVNPPRKLGGGIVAQIHLPTCTCFATSLLALALESCWWTC
jgi:hypothetical protein